MSTNYFYVLTRDDNPDDPREDQDWLGTMACWHRRYKLGDEQPKCDPEEHIRNLVGWDEEKEEAIYQFWFNRAKGSDVEKHIEARKKLRERLAEEFNSKYIWREIYAYEH
jgi:hypothetical protein